MYQIGYRQVVVRPVTAENHHRSGLDIIRSHVFSRCNWSLNERKISVFSLDAGLPLVFRLVSVDVAKLDMQ